MNDITLTRPVLLPQDGLLIGNGDVSVSVYQAADEIRFRFGKGDVWDRRIDFSRDPKPAHIDEVRRGVEVEGWECGPYGGPVKAKNGSGDEGRMREICQGIPPSYRDFPYPCPKPVGELALRLPADAQGMELVQKLDIGQGEILIECHWRGGLRLVLLCFVAGAENVLCIKWKLENWTDRSRFTGDFPGVGPTEPLWFRLYRWNDPSFEDFGEQHFARHRHPGLKANAGFTAKPLPGATLSDDIIFQPFPAEATYPDGFICAIAPLAPDGYRVEPVSSGGPGGAMLHLLPEKLEGVLSIGVASGTGRDGVVSHLARMASGRVDDWQDASRTRASEFWSKSDVFLSDARVQNLWHASLHAKRCIYRADTTPPGLFLPSTISDYSLWHGDYHTNYNFQSIFLGDYASNHAELGDAYFPAMEYFASIGRKIARDYYGCRGVFVQLSGFPATLNDDPLGTVPMGRMAYMTGWAANHYWFRYLHTLDRSWLAEVGYPFIRDCALFYTDFLKVGSDGVYHAFPSNQGEDGFSGIKEDFTDRPQILRHARYCLHIAVEAAKALDIDSALRATWSDIELRLPEFARTLDPLLPPEFYAFDGATPDKDICARPAYLDFENENYRWYPGKLPYLIIQALRTRRFVPERDYGPTADLLNRWTHDNGLLWAMSVGNYGHLGAWTESLGVVGAIQEMLLQTWEGYIRLFPGIPPGQDVSFRTLRGEGAFLISAAKAGGRIDSVEIFSEAGRYCRLENPWHVRPVTVEDSRGLKVDFVHEQGAIVGFATAPGMGYKVRPQEDR